MEIKITEPQYKKLNKNLIKDKNTIDDLQSKFPQWDLTNTTIRHERNSKGQSYRFLDGLYCPKHKTISNNVNVNDLRKRGSGCRECGKERQVESGMTKKPLEQWVLDLDKVGFETKIENFEYKPNKLGKPVLFVKDAICKKCGNKITKYVNAWEMNSGKITCPKCSIGKWKGEETVKEILTGMGLEENVDFFPKHQFSDLRGKLHKRATKKGFSKDVSLPYYFDFYIPEWNTIIEYDGRLHFFSVEGRGGDYNLNDYIHRDARKNNYADFKEIKMIRIPYTTKDKEKMTKEIEDAIASSEKLVTTGNYPKLGWNSPKV